MNLNNWLEISDLAKGLKCSVKSIYNYREEGTFIPGIHFYSVGKGMKRGKHIYSLELCRKALIERTKNKLKDPEAYSQRQVKEKIERRLRRKS